MATRVLLVSLFLSLLVACDKKEDDINPGQSYTGKLALEYVRSFPTFTTSLGIPVEINSAGEVFLPSPQPLTFSGQSDKMIEGERIRISEDGEIVISNLSAKFIKDEGKEYLDVTLSFHISGNQQVWKWNEYFWKQLSAGPYEISDPVSCPMRFRIDNALLSESVCAARCSDCWGHNNFRWRLTLQKED